MTPTLYAACQQAVHVITTQGEVLAAGRASLFVLAELGVCPPLLRLLSYPPFIWFVEWGYRLVANHRPFFSRFLFRP